MTRAPTIRASPCCPRRPTREAGGRRLPNQVMLENLGEQPDAVEKAVKHVTGTKLKSMAAGSMGYPTSQVGDLVAETVAKA